MILDSYIAIWTTHSPLFFFHSVHELGHNLGLDHSQYNGNDYGDATGVMGGADYWADNDDEGRLCFNAAKNYFLGWFLAYNEDLDADVPVYSGELVPCSIWSN